MNYKEDIQKKLITNNDKLSANSLKTYISIIYNLMIKNNIKTLNYFNENYKNILDILENKEPNKRKTILSAILLLIKNDENNEKALKAYKSLMMNDAEIYKNTINKNEKNEKEEENWMEYGDILDIYDDLKKKNKHLLNKNELSQKELQSLQDYIILSLYVLIPPRRLLDYTKMKIRNFTNNDNYFYKGKLYFNNYKTAKYYGEQIIKLPKVLNDILKKWIKINNNDFLLFDKNKNQLLNVQLNQRLNKIFKRKISVNLLRHIYISNLYPDNMPTLEKLEDVGEMMGHNVSQQMKYIKN